MAFLEAALGGGAIVGLVQTVYNMIDQVFRDVNTSQAKRLLNQANAIRSKYERDAINEQQASQELNNIISDIQNIKNSANYRLREAKGQQLEKANSKYSAAASKARDSQTDLQRASQLENKANSLADRGVVGSIENFINGGNE